MTAEIENDLSQILVNVNENYEKQLQHKKNALMNTEPMVEGKKMSKDQFKKMRDKYSLRRSSGKTIKEIYIAKKIRNRDIIPLIPKKVLCIISLLRHKKFLKAVRKYFKVAPEEMPAWNFGNSNGISNGHQDRHQSSNKICENESNNDVKN